MSEAVDHDWKGGARRAGLMFLNFFLIMLAYYQVKPASRSLFLEHASADSLPYVWTASGLLLLVLLPPYQRLLARYDRIRVVQGTTVMVIALLLLFRLLFAQAGAATASAFYILVDIFSVVLVEQFWSLTNSVHDRQEGRRWYGLIGSGGLVGGLAGGFVAGWIVRLPGMQTPDLIVVSACLLTVMIALTAWLDSVGLYARARVPDAAVLATAAVWRSLRTNRFVGLIAVLVLFSQICEPIVEYQFLHMVETAYPEREARTVFLSNFLGLLSGVGLAVNLLVTPLLLRYGGLVAGLLVQPLLLGASTMAFAFNIEMRGAAVMKVTDRALAYSINRSARELLYTSADPHTIFRVKAWIDMAGYRAFRIVGNVAILMLTQLLSWHAGVVVLGGVVTLICVAWIACVLALRPYLAREEELRDEWVRAV